MPFFKEGEGWFEALSRLHPGHPMLPAIQTLEEIGESGDQDLPKTREQLDTLVETLKAQIVSVKPQ